MIRIDIVEALSVADVHDAMVALYGHRTHIIHLESPDPSPLLFGPEVTISILLVRKDFMHSDKHSRVPAIYRPIVDVDPEGKVIVFARDGHPNTLLGGDTKLSRAHHQKMAGILSDGSPRDFEELNSYDFPTY